MGCDDLSGASC